LYLSCIASTVGAYRISSSIMLLLAAPLAAIRQSGIFEQPEVENQLLVYGDNKLGRLHCEPLCKQIEKEMEVLICARKEKKVLIPVRLGALYAQESVEQLKIDTNVADVQSQALTLWSFLVGLGGNLARLRCLNLLLNISNIKD
jgi:hypothetical protein